MQKIYYEIIDNLTYPRRWQLEGLYEGGGRELDSRQFTYGLRLDFGPPMKAMLWNSDLLVEISPQLRMMIKDSGHNLDFTFDVFNAPVVTRDVARVFEWIAHRDIQSIPIQVGSLPQPYIIVNVLSRVACLDSERSGAQLFQPGNLIRPDKVGKAEMVTRLTIDPSRVSGQDVFRVEEWDGPIIISNLIKDELECMNISGVTFRQVSPNSE